MKEDSYPSIQSTLQWIDHKSDFTTISKILPYGTLRKFRKDEYILVQGDMAESVYYLNKGKVRIFMTTPDGKEKTLWYTIAGNIINDVGFFHRHPSNASIVASEDCEMYGFDKLAIRKILTDHPDFSEELLTSMSKRIRVLVHQLETVSFAKPLSQICRFLYSFSKKYGEVHGETMHIQLDITHSELASMNSLHRVTVSKILKNLEKENIIIYNSKGSITIKDMDKLYEYGYSE